MVSNGQSEATTVVVILMLE